MNKLKIITIGLTYVLLSQNVSAESPLLKIQATLEPQCNVSCGTDLNLGNIAIVNYARNSTSYRVEGDKQDDKYVPTEDSVIRGIKESSVNPGVCSVTCPSSVPSITPKVTGLQFVSAPAGVSSLNNCSCSKENHCRCELTSNTNSKKMYVYASTKKLNDKENPTISLTNGSADFEIYGGFEASYGDLDLLNNIVPGTYVFSYSVSIDY